MIKKIEELMKYETAGDPMRNFRHIEGCISHGQSGKLKSKFNRLDLQFAPNYGEITTIGFL